MGMENLKYNKTEEDDTDNDNMEQISLKHKLMSPHDGGQHSQQYIMDFIEKFPSYDRCAAYLQNINAQHADKRNIRHNMKNHGPVAIRSTASPSPSADSSLSISGKKLS